ncbi:unnamed protein product, partial [Symbiodinium sp. CCMP2456]
ELDWDPDGDGCHQPRYLPRDRSASGAAARTSKVGACRLRGNACSYPEDGAFSRVLVPQLAHEGMVEVSEHPVPAQRLTCQRCWHAVCPFSILLELHWAFAGLGRRQHGIYLVHPCRNTWLLHGFSAMEVKEAGFPRHCLHKSDGLPLESRGTG